MLGGQPFDVYRGRAPTAGKTGLAIPSPFDLDCGPLGRPGMGPFGRMDSMSRAFARMRWALCLGLLTGCVSSQHTRLPSLAYNRPDVERRSYEYHDPSPDREAGPEIERPRGFERQRAEPRRINERAGNVTSAGVQSGLSPSAARYPNSVVE